MISDGDLAPPVTGRLGLARLAGRAIALTDGVTSTSGPAGRWRTIVSQQSLPGVLAAEDGRGRVEIELHLVARWPPPASLQQLAEQVRDQLRRSAAMAGVEGRLGAVSVFFDDLLVASESS